jgi:hypothetical protein
MAATIKASHNPVSFPSPHLGTLPQHTNITWDTGANNIRGRVFVSLNGGPEEIFDGNARRQGSKERAVQFGQNLEFRLRQDNPARTLLATVMVTTEKTAGLPAVVIDINNLAGGYSQGIYNLTVTPGFEAVIITFRTRQPTAPFIEISDQDTGKPIYVWKGPDKRQVHQMDMASESPGNRLAQNVRHSYRIVASAMPGSPDATEAVATGTFRTGARTATVFFDTVHVRNDGDPGLKGAGEFTFRFSGGNAATGAPLGNTEVYGQADINTGEDVAVNRALIILAAPPVLWAHVSATEDDRSFFDPGTLGLCTIGTAGGSAPGSFGKDIGACSVASVTEHFDISQTIGGISERPFAMATGNFAIAYDVAGRLRVEAHAGEWFERFVEGRRPLPYAQTPSAIAWVSPNGNAKFVQKQGHAHKLIFGPGGALYHQALGNDPRLEGSWTNLGGRFDGPVTAVATEHEQVYLFGLARDGAALYKIHAPDAGAGDDWQTLGGAFVGRIAVAAGADGTIELFALSEDGSVFQRTLSERGEPQAEWELIGAGIAGSIAALFSPRTGLSLFALGRGREVLYKRRPPHEEWWPVGREWESLGVASDGLLSAEWVGDEAVLLAVVSEDETVHLFAWPNYPAPAPEGWQVVGSVNSLLQGRISGREAAMTSGPPRAAEGRRD